MIEHKKVSHGKCQMQGERKDLYLKLMVSLCFLTASTVTYFSQDSEQNDQILKILSHEVILTGIKRPPKKEGMFVLLRKKGKMKCVVKDSILQVTGFAGKKIILTTNKNEHIFNLHSDNKYSFLPAKKSKTIRTCRGKRIVYGRP